MSTAESRRTVPGLAAMARSGEKVAMLTCYDASFAALLERSGVDAMLVGDSLGMVIGGHASTLPVTLDDMVYHTRCVVAGAKIALISAGMPLGCYHMTPATGCSAAARPMPAGPGMG